MVISLRIVRSAAPRRRGAASQRAAAVLLSSVKRRLAFALGSTLVAVTPLAAQTDDARPPPLARYVIVDGSGVQEPLTETPGNPVRGAAIFSDPSRGGCSGCHAVEGPSDETQIGPALSDVGARLSESALRLWIVNPAFLAPDTAMPAYYSLYDGDATEPTRARPRLAAQEIEDLVAYLNGLTQMAAPEQVE